MKTKREIETWNWIHKPCKSIRKPCKSIRKPYEWICMRLRMPVLSSRSCPEMGSDMPTMPMPATFAYTFVLQWAHLRHHNPYFAYSIGFWTPKSWNFRFGSFTPNLCVFNIQATRLAHFWCQKGVTIPFWALKRVALGAEKCHLWGIKRLKTK